MSSIDQTSIEKLAAMLFNLVQDSRLAAFKHVLGFRSIGGDLDELTVRNQLV